MTAERSTALHCIIAVDGSAHSLAAVRWIARLAAAGVEMRCTLVNVQKPVMSGEVGAIAPAEIALGERERSAAEVLEQASGILRPSGVRLDTEECLDDASTAIVARAEALGCDAIVVGRRGLGALRSALLGSVSAEVIRQSRIPVIVVSAASADVPASAPRFLAAVDGSESAGRAAVFASRLAAAGTGDLHLLHVAQPFTVAGTIFGPREKVVERLSGRQAQEVLEEVRGVLDARATLVEHVVSSDDIVGAVVQAAQDHSCDVVAMGTRGLGPLAGQLLGSVAQGMLERAEHAGIVLVLVR